jgi:hypothetical protein
MLEKIPDLKTKSLTDKITIPVEPELKTALMKLKAVHKKDHLEWVRRLIRNELAKLELS